MNGKENQLQQMLTQLRTKLLVMAASVGIALDEACAALSEGNVGRASAVIDGDEAINMLENEVDEMALALLVRNQPVAQDLRFVIGALRMVIDLERIGDEAVTIAERAVILQQTPPEGVMLAAKPLILSALASYRDTINAFKAADAAAALRLCRNDDETTQQEVTALQRIMDDFCGGREHAASGNSYAGMHAILICRSLSRICRRAANIAEHTYFIAEGVNIKHKRTG